MIRVLKKNQLLHLEKLACRRNLRPEYLQTLQSLIVISDEDDASHLAGNAIVISDKDEDEEYGNSIDEKFIL